VQQTLEVLLTTPLRAAEIVAQKAKVMRRLIWVLALPLLTIFGVEWIAETEGSLLSWDGIFHSPGLYILCVVLTLAVYLPLVSWLSLSIGLAMRTRFRAIMTALITIVTWCGLPIFLGVVTHASPDKATMLFFYASPLLLPGVNEMGDFRELNASAPWLPLLLNFTCYGAILYVIRKNCLRQADRFLRQ
jgi:ABC-type Na+ efflux pump permease subunit